MPEIPEAGRGPAMRERRSEFKQQNVDDLKKRLTDEYKILQDKIDKIGAFRFTIKGWAVTAIGVSAAAASATQGLAVASFISTGLAVLVIFLFQFEIEQVRLSRLFGFLAGRIERAFLELDTNKLKRGFATPVIGGEIVKAKEVRRQRRRFRWWLIWPILDGRQHSARRFWWEEIKEDWAVRRSANMAFYVFLFFLAFLPLAVKLRPFEAKIGLARLFCTPDLPASPVPPRMPGVSAK